MSGPGQDPVWDEYVEAVGGLARLPVLMGERTRSVKAEEDASVQRAQSALDAGNTLFAEWVALARRTMTTAEARLVAARVLVPDAALASTVPHDTPDALVDQLVALDRRLAAEVGGLEDARRQARAEAMQQAAARRRQSALRKELYRIGAAVLAIVVFALLIDALT